MVRLLAEAEDRPGGDVERRLAVERVAAGIRAVVRHGVADYVARLMQVEEVRMRALAA
jgi:hypothetical protein